MRVRRIAIMAELIGYSVRRRQFIMLPLLVVILALSALIVFAETSAIAPFLYPFF